MAERSIIGMRVCGVGRRNGVRDARHTVAAHVDIRAELDGKIPADRQVARPAVQRRLICSGSGKQGSGVAIQNDLLVFWSDDHSVYFKLSTIVWR